MQAVLDLAVEAAQVRRQEVSNHVACTNLIRVDAEAQCIALVQGREDHVGADTVRAEGAEHVVIVMGSGQIATQADFTETTGQAHRRTTTEVQTTGTEATGRAVVVAESAFEPEAGCQAAAEVFDAAEADAAGIQIGIAENGLASTTVAARVMADGSVDDTEQGHGRLSRGGTGSSQDSQSN
jgi:hypothetical protein